MNALIGFSGFIGSTLLSQANFSARYRSTTISEIDGKSFDTVVCAGAPAQKWIANRNPTADLQNINMLIEHLKTIRCKNFILISTVDVFKNSVGMTESSLVIEDGLHAYGLHRRKLEIFVQNFFEHSLIARLPGLVGPGLRKNIIFDFLNSNQLHLIDHRSVFQFYPVVHLWKDLQTSLHARLNLVHLTAEPVSVAHVSELAFGKPFNNILDQPFANYDLRTLYAKAFGVSGSYQYSAQESIEAIRAYVASA